MAFGCPNTRCHFLLPKIMEEEKSQLNDQVAAEDAVAWAKFENIKIDGRPYDLSDRKYQFELMRNTTSDGKFKENEAIRKGAQIGVSMIKVIEVAHGALHGLYQQGIIIYFPSQKSVEIFSQSRFKPFVEDNPITIRKHIGKGQVSNTTMRRLGTTNVYFFGGSATSRIGGEKKDSTAVRSTPADWVILDERDLFDEDMAKQINQRLGNSLIRRRSDVSTPSIPEFGIDLLYKKCVVPETKILTTDLRWKRAGKLKVGDRLIGFDEEGAYKKSRRYRTTEVTNCERVELPCLKVTFDDGTVTTISWLHKFLSVKEKRVCWRKAKDLKIGDRIISLGMWEEGNSKEDGWISGIYDGEGHICKSKAAMIGFTQKEGLVLDKVEKLLSDKGFITKKYKIPSGCFRLDIRGGMPDKLRFMGIFRPERLFEKVSLLWEGISVGNDMGYTKTPKVSKIEYVGFKKVIALATEHKTFIADGLLSHNSDRRRWQIHCEACNKFTCAETEFPNVIKLDSEGIGYLGCSHCGRKLHRSSPKSLWVPDCPDRITTGYWPSQLLNPNVSLARVLRQFEDPEAYDMDIGECHRTIMGEPYISVDDQLSESDVYACCGQEAMEYTHKGPCAMGVDVGVNSLHVVIGHRTGNNQYKLVKMARIPVAGNWNGLHDIARKFNVKSAVIDAMPETNMGRTFQKEERMSVYLCYYAEHLKVFDTWSDDGVIKVNRTEIFDETHHLVREPGRLVIPRVCEEVKEFARQMICAARVVEKDQRTGTPIARYRKVGDKEDHYRNALNYFFLACRKVGIPSKFLKRPKVTMQDMSYSL